MREWKDIWRSLFPRRTIRRDVDDELRFHLEGRVDELMDQGVSEPDARSEAVQRFGDVEAVRSACAEFSRQRIQRQELRTVLDTLRFDSRLAARTLRKDAGFAGVVVLTLAVGIGATTVLFSVVNGVLLAPLPYEDADRLAIIWQNDRATGTVREAASVADYFDFEQRSRSFAGMAMYSAGTATLTRDDGEPERTDLAVVSANLDDVLGIRAPIGRGINDTEDDPGGDLVVVLADRFWRSAFRGDPDVVGGRVRLDGELYTIVGVLPPGLDFPSHETDLWAPLQASRATAQRNPHWVRVIGRLAPDVSAAVAHDEMVRIAAELEAEFPANLNRGAFVEPLTDVLRGDLRLSLWVLFAAVAAVLLIGCLNVANLMLARGATRTQEVAVCAAVGASTGRLARRFLIESLLLTGAAMLLGVVLAMAGLRIILALVPAEVFSIGAIGLDGAVLAFAVGLSAAIGVGFGLLPTLQTGRVDLQSTLKDGRALARSGAASRMWLRRLLVTAQLATAVVLLVVAGLLIGTLLNLQSVDPGFDPQHLLRLDFRLPVSRYPQDMQVWPNWPATLEFNREAVERVEALPGVLSAAITSNHPLQAGWTNSFEIVGRPPDPDQGEMSVRIVTPGYFKTVGVKLLAGRFMEPGDDAESPLVMILNRAAVERHFPERRLEGVLGEQISLWGPWEREVIGVIDNERTHGLDRDPPPAMYVNLHQAPQRSTATLMVRTRGDSHELVRAVREAVWSIDPDLALYNVATMEETLAAAVARERFLSTLLGVFAAAATFLAALGVYGLLSYLVARRGEEIGIRMALGASPTEIVRSVAAQGATLTVVGVGLGLAGALALSRLLTGLLHGISPTEPLAYLGVVATLGLASLLASTLPALRAARVDPLVSLRRE